jgi:ABC-2 type transport system permease protein
MPSNAFPIAGRVIHQLVRDRRTLALIIIVPLVVMTLISYSFPENKAMLSLYAPALLATLALFFSFLLTGISFLRERTQGTMERMMASPVSRLDMVLGYLLGFFIFALTQSLIVLLFTIRVLGVTYSGDLWQIFIFLIVIVTMAVNLGIFASAFARNEFQMIQFIPLIIFPQVFLCGVIWPVDQMHTALQWIAKFLPLKYAVGGMEGIMIQGSSLLDVGFELGILVAFVVVISILAALTLRRGSSG